jgi:hypothetical protein
MFDNTCNDCEALFLWHACGVLIFWRALRLPNEFLAGLGWGFSLAGTRAALALIHAALAGKSLFQTLLGRSSTIAFTWCFLFFRVTFHKPGDLPLT